MTKPDDNSEFPRGKRLTDSECECCLEGRGTQDSPGKKAVFLLTVWGVRLAVEEDEEELLAVAEAEAEAVLTNLSNKLSLAAPLLVLSNNNWGFGAIFGWIKDHMRGGGKDKEHFGKWTHSRPQSQEIRKVINHVIPWWYYFSAVWSSSQHGEGRRAQRTVCSHCLRC